MSRGAYVLSLDLVPYAEAFDLQRSLAGAVSQGAIPETVLFLQHPPVVTLGRRTETDEELHIPDDAEVEIAETDRGGEAGGHGAGRRGRGPDRPRAGAARLLPHPRPPAPRKGRKAVRAEPRGGAHPCARGARAR